MEAKSCGGLLLLLIYSQKGFSNPNGGPEGTGVRMRSFHMTKTTPHYVTVTQRDVIQENHNKQLKKLEGA